jgi:hypothetical protein
MFPNLFALLRADSAVTAILGTAPMRFYRHGEAPQNVAAPYVTQRVIDGVPENHLDGLPPVDRCLIQVSLWSPNTGSDLTAFEVLCNAVRDCIEARWHITDAREMGRDPVTSRYRVDLDVTVFDHRAVPVPPPVTGLQNTDGTTLLNTDGTPLEITA